jgi:hypothetical protein
MDKPPTAAPKIFYANNVGIQEQHKDGMRANAEQNVQFGSSVSVRLP